MKRSIGLICLTLAFGALRSEAFWLTEGNLFQTSLFPERLKDDQVISVAEASPNSSVTTLQTNQSETSSQEQQVRENAQKAEEVRGGSAIADSISKDTSRQEEGSSANNFVAQAAAACQCNPDWLQRETGSWMSRWLNSSNFANQVRAHVLAAAPQAKASQQQQHAQHGNGRPGQAWNRQTNRRNGGGNHASVRQSRHPRPSGKPNAPGSGSPPASAQVPPPTQLKLVQGERGPKGEKGDKGEQGPDSLRTVKDRAALFDLQSEVARTKDSTQEKTSQIAADPVKTGAPRLVFIEAEQTLVIETTSGWRPIPLLAPLHDFRKTIAKFSLSVNDWKQLRQMSAGDGNEARAVKDNLISPAEPIKSIRISPFSRLNSSLGANSATLSALDSNSISNAIKTAGTKSDGLDLGDDDNDDDDDDVDDEDEEEEEDEDEAEEGEDDEDEVDNEDRARMANAINPRNEPKAEVGLDKVVLTSSADKMKRRRAQVSGRSAFGASPQISGDNLAHETEPGSFVVKSGGQEDNVFDADHGPTSAKRLRLIALNEPYSGNQHGLRGANFECKRNAARAGVKGAFRAFLATSYQNLNEIVRQSAHVQKYPIENLRGDILAASWHDLLKSPARATNPLSRIYSFDGRHVASDPNWPNKLVWLGTGSKVGARDPTSHNCDGWHSDSLNKLGYASPLHSPKNHLHNNHNQNGQQVPNQSRRRTQQRRFVGGPSGLASADDSSLAKNQNSTGSTGANMVFDILEKYPCRMPLVVLCIETVAQGE